MNELLNQGFNFYQHANVDLQQIKDNFLIRLYEYETIIDDIRRNPMTGSVQHYLLLGRRGSGKSTLLRRIQAELELDPVLKEVYLAVNLAEEQANIYKLYDLLEEVIQELRYNGIVIQQPEWKEDEHLYTRELFAVIHEGITLAGKKIILLLDNIDRIFENLKEDAALLREHLLNYDDVKIIGGSTRMTEPFWKYNQPFYQFFRVFELNVLSHSEIKLLLLDWSARFNIPELRSFIENKPSQLETIRLLTDGLPRTLMFFVDILIRHKQDNSYEYIRLIMDKVTPLYQERLNNLPPSQRKIVLQMAFIWEAAGAKEISEATKMDNKLISAQLKQLVEKGVAEKIETNTKNHLYRLSERFFNLWLIFTQGSPADKRKARFLTIFLENFYDEHEIREMGERHLKKIIYKWELNEEGAAYKTKALVQSKFISMSMRDLLIEETLSLNIHDELKKQLPPRVSDIFKQVVALSEKQNWTVALGLLNSIEQEDDFKQLFLGYVYFSSGDYQNAEINFLQSMAILDNEKAITIGRTFERAKEYIRAEKFYRIAFNRNEEGALHLGELFLKQNKIQQAEEYFLIAHQQGKPAATLQLGGIYIERQQLEVAEKYLLLLVDNYKLPGVLKALSWVYYTLNKKKKETLELIETVSITDGDEWTRVMMIIIKIWNGIFVSLEEDVIKLFKENNEHVASLLCELVVHKQERLVWKLLNDDEVMKDFKNRNVLTYYALSVYLNKGKKIINIVPPEMNNPVLEIIESITLKGNFYYGE